MHSSSETFKYYKFLKHQRPCPIFHGKVLLYHQIGCHFCATCWNFSDKELFPLVFDEIFDNQHDHLVHAQSETTETSGKTLKIVSSQISEPVNLENSNGFIAHFYSISEAVMPAITLGFLGTDGRIGELCQYFRVSSRFIRICLSSKIRLHRNFYNKKVEILSCSWSFSFYRVVWSGLYSVLVRLGYGFEMTYGLQVENFMCSISSWKNKNDFNNSFLGPNNTVRGGHIQPEKSALHFSRRSGRGRLAGAPEQNWGCADQTGQWIAASGIKISWKLKR